MSEAGVILAGGLSRRMGGNEKSLLKLADKEPITWVSERLSPQCKHLAINANGEPSRFSFLSHTVIPDTVEGFVGPLAGVLAGMEWAKSIPGITHIVTAAADTPFIPADLVLRLRAAATGSDNGISMAHSRDRVHPVFGYWPITLANDLQRFLVIEDKRKILEFARRYTLNEVNFDDAGYDPFFNINTPEDLTHAERMVKEGKHG